MNESAYRKHYDTLVEAENHLRDWCSFKGMPCGECPFSIPAADDGSDYDEASSTWECGLLEIMETGEGFRGYRGAEEQE
ncbi:hypothetical protein ACTNCI_07580 [Mitsuokella jalaludinii]|uniref:hypothetical protein n=1 Tax=Mitsuokella jalaludinii TaxID=187979 RepID=UPI003F8B1B91